MGRPSRAEYATMSTQELDRHIKGLMEEEIGLQKKITYLEVQLCEAGLHLEWVVHAQLSSFPRLAVVR